MDFKSLIKETKQQLNAFGNIPFQRRSHDYLIDRSDLILSMKKINGLKNEPSLSLRLILHPK